MRVRVLGSAAGGGSPQWNCACGVCTAVREDSSLPTRLTCTIALEDGLGGRFLCNAGPDLGVQLREWAAVSPPRETRMPIDGVLLTDGELDHAVGLLALRQAGWLRIWGTATVRKLLDECGLLPTLRSYTDVEWCEVGGSPLTLLYGNSAPAPLECIAVPVGNGRLPRYAPSGLGAAEASVAYIVRDRRTGKSVAIAPSIARMREDLVCALGAANVAIVDGTFWDEDELHGTGRSSASAGGLGHVAVSHGLGARIAGQGAQVVFTHLNNTNPMLLPDSVERLSLIEQGFLIADDGLELAL
ncbi:MAG: pyrroloquinoline quinone biosynthesis protein PqqB [Frankiaceae bacterium]